MGGAVSSGRDNNELIDNLIDGNYIRTRCVERVFRALDRADYMTPESRDQAYKDLAWRNGALHMSSPCIYSEVMEGLELKPGLSFLNVGSGTGYLSTLAGLILGSGGISHGIEVHSSVVDYANKKLSLFIANSPTLDEFDFCEPKFYVGNGLCLTPRQQPYDRVYCGAACPDEYENYFKQLIKVGGLLVMPHNDALLQVRRVAPDRWVSRTLLTVSFIALRVPPADQLHDYVKLEEQAPPRLQVVARGAVRACMRRGVLRRHPELRETTPRRPPPASCPRHICIPIEPRHAAAGLNFLHDLDAATGANEMNALLSLVIRMDQNRGAGAIRFEGGNSSSERSEDSTEEGRSRRNRAARTRPASGARVSSDTTGSDEGSGSAKDGTPEGRESGTTGSVGRSPRNESASGRSGPGTRSRDRSGRRSDRSSSDDATNPRSRRGRRGGDDDKSSRQDKCRRGPPTGRLFAFEFQASERGARPTTSSGAGRGSDTSSASSSAGDGKESNDDAPKSQQGSCDCKNAKDIIPSEVRLCYRGSTLQALLPGPSGADMDWEESETKTERAKESADDAHAESGSKSKAKRLKLDSGIGENTASCSSTDKSTTDDTDTDEKPSASLTEDSPHSPHTRDSNAASRRHVHKLTRLEARSSSSSAEESGAGGAGGAGGAAERRRAARGARGRGCGQHARRVRLSIVMKRAIKELPLPYPLKKYVNLGRCFEF